MFVGSTSKIASAVIHLAGTSFFVVWFLVMAIVIKVREGNEPYNCPAIPVVGQGYVGDFTRSYCLDIYRTNQAFAWIIFIVGIMTMFIILLLAAGNTSTPVGLLDSSEVDQSKASEF